MPRVRQNFIECAHQFLGALTKSLVPSEKNARLDNYLTNWGVWHLIKCDNKVDAEERLLNLPFVGTLLNTEDNYTLTLRYWRHLGIKKGQIGYQRMADELLETSITKNELPNINNCVKFLSYAGWISSSLVIGEKSLMHYLHLLGAEHPDVAGSYNNLGTAYLRKGEYNKAIEYHEKALEIQLKSLGGKHSDVAENYSGLGTAYYHKGEYDKAIGYCEKALEIWLKSLGNDHPDLTDGYSGLGAAYLSKGEYDKAIEYNEKTLEIQLKSLGNEHPNVALSFNNLGSTYQEKGEYDKAIDYYEKAASIYDILKQPDDVKEIRDRISKIHSKLTDTSE